MKRFIVAELFTLCGLLCATVCSAQVLQDSAGTLWQKISGVRLAASIGAVSSPKYSLIATTTDCFVTQDSGRTWKGLSRPLPLEYIKHVAVRGDSLFAVAPSGTTYLTTDGGLMWFSTSRGSAFIGGHQQNSTWHDMYSTCKQDTFRARSWTGVAITTIGPQYSSVTEVCATPYGIFLLDSERGLLVQDLDDNLLRPIQPPEVSASPGPVMAYCDGSLYVPFGTRFFRLHLASERWSEVFAGQGITAMEITSIAVQAGMWFAGTRYGGIVSGSNDHNVAISINKSLEQLLITAIHPVENGVILQTLLGGLIAINTSSWTLTRMPHPEPPTANSLCVAFSGKLAVGVTASGRVYQSRSSASRWTQIQTKLPEHSVHALSFDNGVLYAASDSGVLMSIDTGRSWNTVPELSDIQHVVSVKPTPHGLVVIAGSGVWLKHANNVRSIFSVVDGSNPRVLDVAYTKDVLYAASKDGVLWTTDGGATWNLDTVRENVAVRSISVHPFGLLAIGDAGDMYIKQLSN